MNLINRDFEKRENKTFLQQQVSSVEIARVYRAAEREALNRMGLKNKEEACYDELGDEIIKVLCSWIACD